MFRERSIAHRIQHQIDEEDARVPKPRQLRGLLCPAGLVLEHSSDDASEQAVLRWDIQEVEVPVECPRRSLCHEEQIDRRGPVLLCRALPSRPSPPDLTVSSHARIMCRVLRNSQDGVVSREAARLCSWRCRHRQPVLRFPRITVLFFPHAVDPFPHGTEVRRWWRTSTWTRSTSTTAASRTRRTSGSISRVCAK